mgnify:FL=1
MRKKTLIVGVLGLALLAGGVLVASNMGFKLSYLLDAPGNNGSATGTTTIALPYYQQTNLHNAEDLINDINAVAGSPVVASVARFVKSTDGLEAYTGFSGVNFLLVQGEGYFVTVSQTVNYIVVGSHNPSLVINLEGPGGARASASGTNLWSYPYHSTKGFAEDLIAEIDGAAGSSVVDSVARFVRTNDGLEAYTGFSGVNFPLQAGEAYFITVSSDVSFLPAHY